VPVLESFDLWNGLKIWPLAPPTSSAALAVQQWREALAVLVDNERALADALTLCAAAQIALPRGRAITVERMRQEAAQLFEIALDAIDALSTESTGATGFGLP